MDNTLAYERQVPADKAFADYDFSNLRGGNNSIVDTGRWEVATRASQPDRTLMRTLKLNFNNRTYYRVFAVVFDDGLNVEDVSFGDLLP